MEMNVFLKNFVDILEDTDETLITGNTVLRDLDEWDSLTALSMIAMADEEYSVKLTGDDIKSSITLQDIFEIIKNKA
jgi:acyl carrier protein